MRHIIIIINPWSIYLFFIQDQCCQCLMKLKYHPDFPFNSLPSEVAAWCYLWSSCGATQLPHPRCQCTGALTLSGCRTGAPWAFCSQETGLLCCHSEWSSRKCCQWSEWRTWTVLPSFLTQPQASVQIKGPCANIGHLHYGNWVACLWTQHLSKTLERSLRPSNSYGASWSHSSFPLMRYKTQIWSVVFFWLLLLHCSESLG